MAKWIPFLLGALAVLAGCARVSATSTIAADGSITRTVRYSVTKGDFGDSQGPSDPSKVFDIPYGPGIQANHNTTSAGDTITVTRHVLAGAPPLTDVTVRDKKGNPFFTSTVQVRKMANGNLEYSESLRCVQNSTNGAVGSAAELRPEIKKLLPDRFQNTAQIDRITSGVMQSVIGALLGPPVPTFMNMMFDPDLASHLMATALYEHMIRMLEGEGLTDAEASRMTKSILVVATNDLNSVSSKLGTSSGDLYDMTPFTFAVKFPGKVISTNGLLDPLSGEVYWSLYGVSVEVAPVTLHLVINPAED